MTLKHRGREYVQMRVYRALFSRAILILEIESYDVAACG